MKQSNTAKYAYAAGFIDGEGCVMIRSRKAKNGRSKQHSLFVQAVQKDGRPMDWLYGTFGGILTEKFYAPGIANPNGLHMYEWRISDREAQEFLKHIVPFLTLKKEQAFLGIRFADRKRFHGTKGAKLSDHELAVRDQMEQRMKELKRETKRAKLSRYYGSCAGVETKCDDPSLKKGSDSPTTNEKKLVNEAEMTSSL